MDAAARVSPFVGAEGASGTPSPAAPSGPRPAGGAVLNDGPPPAPANMEEAIAREASAEQAAGDDAIIADLPTDPSAYRMPRPQEGTEPLGVAEVQSLQTAALAIGLHPAEFQTIVGQGAFHAAMTGGRPLSRTELMLAARRTEADLERRHGEDGAATIATHAMAVVNALRPVDANLARALHELVTTNRVMCEAIAHVGRRNERRAKK